MSGSLPIARIYRISPVMTAPIKTNAFKTGNSVAVRLPKEFGVRAGEPLEVTRDGSGFHIRRVVDADQQRARLAEMVRKLRELGPVVGADPNDGRFEFPDRPGLY